MYVSCCDDQFLIFSRWPHFSVLTEAVPVTPVTSSSGTPSRDGSAKGNTDTSSGSKGSSLTGLYIALGVCLSLSAVLIALAVYFRRRARRFRDLQADCQMDTYQNGKCMIGRLSHWRTVNVRRIVSNTGCFSACFGQTSWTAGFLFLSSCLKTVHCQKHTVEATFHSVLCVTRSSVVHSWALLG